MGDRAQIARAFTDELETMANDTDLECEILKEKLTFRKGRIAVLFSKK